MFVSTFRVLLLCVAAVLIAGCKSPPSGAEGSQAWVYLTNLSPGEITSATKDVFVREGYKVAKERPMEITFERPGSVWDDLEQGGWDVGVTVRVQAILTPRGDDVYLLHCRASLVRNPGDPVFEDPHSLTRLRRRPFQTLLDQVKTHLAVPP